MDAKATGGLIARRRKEKGMSQGELAERLHVTDKAVSRWETGRGMPSVELLEPLAEALDLTVSELLSGRELTAEELPRAAEVQVMETMRQERRTRWKSVLTTALALIGIAAIGNRHLAGRPLSGLRTGDGPGGAGAAGVHLFGHAPAGDRV